LLGQVEKKSLFSRQAIEPSICKPMADYILRSEELLKLQFTILMEGADISILVVNLLSEEIRLRAGRLGTYHQERQDVVG
jgi:hypothetical protein